MKFLAAIFLVAFHQIFAEVCSPDNCARVRCAQVTSCPPGTYMKSGGTCNCCSVCVNYQGVGQSCKDRECLPGELVCNNNKVCESTYVPQFCNAAFCVNEENCTGGKVLLPRDTSKCRCCDVCALPNETENPHCKNGNYVN